MCYGCGYVAHSVASNNLVREEREAMARPSQARKEHPSGTDRYQQLVAHTRVGIFRSTP
jgi:hypothetical protein